MRQLERLFGELRTEFTGSKHGAQWTLEQLYPAPPPACRMHTQGPSDTLRSFLKHMYTEHATWIEPSLTPQVSSVARAAAF